MAGVLGYSLPTMTIRHAFLLVLVAGGLTGLTGCKSTSGSNASPASLLIVHSMIAVPFQFHFVGELPFPGADKQFRVLTGPKSEPAIARIGEEVLGFQIVRYEPKTAQRDVDGEKKDVNVSELTLQRGDCILKLVQGQDVRYTEYTTTLVYVPGMRQLPLKVGQPFAIGDKHYGMTRIDPRAMTCVVTDVDTEEQILVTQQLKTQQ